MGSAEERMLEADLVQEMIARRERGEGIKRIARELGVDRKTVKRWLKLGAWTRRITRNCCGPAVNRPRLRRHASILTSAALAR
jgi:transposase-like protein